MTNTQALRWIVRRISWQGVFRSRLKPLPSSASRTSLIFLVQLCWAHVQAEMDEGPLGILSQSVDLRAPLLTWPSGNYLFPSGWTEWKFNKVHSTTLLGSYRVQSYHFGEGKDETWAMDPILKELTSSWRQRDTHGNRRTNKLGNMLELQPSVEGIGRRNNLWQLRDG